MAASTITDIFSDTGVTVQPLSDALGAAISGVDLRFPLSDDTFDVIKTALFQSGVIVIRDQDLTPEQHIAFAERWGKINVNRFFKPVDGYPQIAEVRKEPQHTENIGAQWHTDHSYDTAPALGSILYAREVPKFGGDTLFASMYRAYDALSDGLKATLGHLDAVHSSRHTFGAGAQDRESRRTGRIGSPEKAVQDAVHPVVITHPGSGRKSLYVNPEFTVGIAGWHPSESQALLNYLYTHAGQPHFTTRVSWRRGTLVMWDNRATWHCALNDYQGQRRLMHRITVEGEPLKGVA